MKWLKRKRKFRGKIWLGGSGVYYWICYHCRDDQLSELTLTQTLHSDVEFGGLAIDINHGSDLLRNHLVVVHGEIK